MKQITANVKLNGGRLLSAKNANNIIARALTATDKWGNRLDKDGKSPIYERRNDPPYFQRWTIHKEAEGYCWKEVTSGSGICGLARTVRELVIKTLCCGLFGPRENIVVEVLP